MVDLTHVELDFTKYEKYIGAEFNINYVDKEKLFRALAFAEACHNTCEYHMDNQLKYLQGGYNTIGKSAVKVPTILMNAGIPKKIFENNKNSSGISFAAEVQDKLSSYLKETYDITEQMLLVLNYIYFKQDNTAYASIVSSMTKNLSNNLVVNSDVRGHEGKELMEMYNRYIPAITGRYYANSVAIVQLPQKIRQCIVVPNNYIMLCLDLKQIDMRVAYNVYLRSWYPEYDAIYDAEKNDKYKAMYIIVAKHLGHAPDMTYFEQHRAGIKKNILSAMYGAKIDKLMQTLDDREFNNDLIKFFNTHKGRNFYVSLIKRLYDMKTDFIVKDFFGFEIDICIKDLDKKYKGENIPLDKVMDYVFSRTIQSTSNSIIVKWTNNLIDSVRARGIEDNKMWINMLRHDEQDITVHKSILDDLPELYSSMRIRIADWDEIAFDMDIFVHYEEEEGTLSEYEQKFISDCREIVNKNIEKYSVHELPMGTRIKPKCIPLVFDVYCFTVMSPQELYKSLLFRETEKSDLEVAEEISNLSQEGVLPPKFMRYKDYYNKYVLVNPVTKKKMCFNGFFEFITKIGESNIEYVIASTVHGDEYSLAKNCYIKADSLTSTSILDTLDELYDVV